MSSHDCKLMCICRCMFVPPQEASTVHFLVSQTESTPFDWLATGINKRSIQEATINPDLQSADHLQCHRDTASAGQAVCTINAQCIRMDQKVSNATNLIPYNMLKSSLMSCEQRKSNSISTGGQLYIFLVLTSQICPDLYHIFRVM